MHVFISWSGRRSHLVADVLHRWLRTYHGLSPWISTSIEKGNRWRPEVLEKLRCARVGIICITPENATSPWLNFEAGAISNTPSAHVCTLLIDLAHEDVPEPLSQFQSTIIGKQELWSLFCCITSKLAPIELEALNIHEAKVSFERQWPALERGLLNAVSSRGPKILDDLVGSYNAAWVVDPQFAPQVLPATQSFSELVQIERAFDDYVSGRGANPEYGNYTFSGTRNNDALTLTYKSKDKRYPQILGIVLLRQVYPGLLNGFWIQNSPAHNCSVGGTTAWRRVS